MNNLYHQHNTKTLVANLAVQVICTHFSSYVKHVSVRVIKRKENTRGAVQVL